ncbi:hypothetical protein XENORESO_010498 [Xenotaenia resolanae]|uniref:Uncharacterized protein n=1 Tax=Xenotaenia resolanae TaxID=208358 RepID=A0ABV0VSH2_9TELE
MMLPPPYFTIGMGFIRLASFPLFSPNVTMVTMAKHFSLITPQHTTGLQILQFLPLSMFANCILAFYVVWSNDFFLTEWSFSPCWYRTSFSTTLNPVPPCEVRVHGSSNSI